MDIVKFHIHFTINLLEIKKLIKIIRFHYSLFRCFLNYTEIQAQNQRYSPYPFLNEDGQEHLNQIQNAYDNGCNAAAITIQWGSIYGFHSTQYPAGTGWDQYDHQISKIRSLGMKIGIRINVNTACPKVDDQRMELPTCDGWPASERMYGAKFDGSDPLYVHTEHGGPSNGNPAIWVDGVMTSLASHITKDRITSFTREVINRYNCLANTNELLYVNLVYNRTSEAGFDTETTKNEGAPVLFPNPASREFTATFDITDDEGEVTIKLADVQGYIIFEKKRNGSGHVSEKFVLNDIAPQLLIIQITSRKNVSAKKILIR